MANYIDAHQAGMEEMTKVAKLEFDTQLHQVMLDTDWDLLTRQKQALLDMPFAGKEAENLIDGLINWIDSLQEAVVHDGVAPVSQVFPADDEAI